MEKINNLPKEIPIHEGLEEIYLREEIGKKYKTLFNCYGLKPFYSSYDLGS